MKTFKSETGLVYSSNSRGSSKDETARKSVERKRATRAPVRDSSQFTEEEPAIEEKVEEEDKSDGGKVEGDDGGNKNQQVQQKKNFLTKSLLD